MALRCPRLFHYRYVDKIREPEVMPEALIGKAIHKALEDALQGTPVPEALAEARNVLDDEHDFRRYDTIGEGVQPFIDRIAEFRRRNQVRRQMIEFTLAVTEDVKPTQFYSGDAFYRGVFDAAYVYGGDTIALIDHKTGFRLKSRTITEQLEGYAVLAAAQFKNLRRFFLGIHWVGDADVEWARPILPSEISQRFVPNVLDNIEAAALAVHDGPRPNPSVWCYRCNYRSLCPAAQEMRFEPVDDEEPDPGIS
jgi:hypothetical protein